MDNRPDPDVAALLDWVRLLDPNHLRALVLTAAWLLDDQQRCG